jgi:hypothetical protein
VRQDFLRKFLRNFLTQKIAQNKIKKQSMFRAARFFTQKIAQNKKTINVSCN